MNNIIWKQYDSRWGSKPYPSGSTMAGCGCGCVACTHVAMEQERYAKWTPENLRPWMVKQGFAIRGQGTRWEGITETLKHLGHKKVVRIYNDPMSEAWKELDKGNRIGIFLFGGGPGPDGTVWTGGGHYVAFTDYKVSNGKHWFYCKDSGGRNHSGWYSYERSMKGRVPKMWIVERVGKQAKTPVKKKTTYKGTYPAATVGSSIGSMADKQNWQSFLNWWGFNLSVDGVFGPQTKQATIKFQKAYSLDADGVAGPATIKKAKSVGSKEKR